MVKLGIMNNRSHEISLNFSKTNRYGHKEVCSDPKSGKFIFLSKERVKEKRSNAISTYF